MVLDPEVEIESPTRRHCDARLVAVDFRKFAVDVRDDELRVRLVQEDARGDVLRALQRRVHGEGHGVHAEAQLL